VTSHRARRGKVDSWDVSAQVTSSQRISANDREQTSTPRRSDLRSLRHGRRTRSTGSTLFGAGESPSSLRAFDAGVERLLIDECLSQCLLAVAKERGLQANHIVWLGKSGARDWNLVPFAVDNDYTFVTRVKTHEIHQTMVATRQTNGNPPAGSPHQALGQNRN
jgi:hypothetical protein